MIKNEIFLYLERIFIPIGYHNPMPLPNSGTIGFLQSFLCNTNVSCRLKPFDVQTSSLKN
jgi:hypothetical protein